MNPNKAFLRYLDNSYRARINGMGRNDITIYLGCPWYDVLKSTLKTMPGHTIGIQLYYKLAHVYRSDVPGEIRFV